jgi:hypothetical protein
MIAAEQEIWLDDLRLFRLATWAERFPRLVQGITGRARDLDFGEATGWQRLISATEVSAIVRCRQVHGARVELQNEASHTGVHVLGEADALVTSRSGVLLVVTVADCVPVYLLDPEGLRPPVWSRRRSKRCRTTAPIWTRCTFIWGRRFVANVTKLALRSSRPWAAMHAARLPWTSGGTSLT